MTRTAAAPVFERVLTTRIVATPVALDAALRPAGHVALRTAADEVLITPPLANPQVADEHAIVLADGSWFGGWIAPALALAVLERECEWEVPHARPAFAQGMVAGLPVKLWFESERVLVLVAAPFAHDLAERFVA